MLFKFGIKPFLQNIPTIRIGLLTKSPYQYTLRAASTEELYHWVPIIEEKLKTIPMLIDVASDLQIHQPQVRVEIDRAKASALGVTVQQIQAALGAAYGSQQVSTIYTATNQYAVILEVEPRFQRGIGDNGLCQLGQGIRRFGAVSESEFGP